MKKKMIKTIGCIVAVVFVIQIAVLIYYGRKDFAGPFKGLSPWKVSKEYDAQTRQNEIVFYGASNFARWTELEEDLTAYKVQNHGFGGSTDKDLVKYADSLLYRYNPKIVFFQTGSNDYVNMTGSDEEKVNRCMEYKREMFTKFHEQLPDTIFVVMSGLLLPGRSEYTKMTQQINHKLQELCEQNNYMYFVDASNMTYDGNNYDKTLFVDDGIHFNRDGQTKWAKDYINPAIEKVIKEKNLASVRK